MFAENSVRVAVITSNYWPERTGIGQVTTEFAEYLASRGVDVRVATAKPYYPEWSIYPGYRRNLWTTEVRNGVTIHRAAHYAAPNPTTFSRIWHEITLCFLTVPNVIRALRNVKAAFVVSPDLSHAFVGCVLARLLGVPVTLIVQDVMPDAAIDMGMLTNKLVIGVSRLLAHANYALANTINTLSHGMKERIARAIPNTDKIKIVPNTIESGELALGPDQGKIFRDRFVPSGVFAVIHTGNMGEKQDLPLLLRTARRLITRPDIHFFVFGDGAVKEEFLRVKEAWRLTNVSHYPLQERSLLPHMLFGADACLVSQRPEVVDVVVPSKLITAMGAGAMIIAACSPNSESAKIIEDSGGGVHIAASDDAALASALIRLVNGNIDTAATRGFARAYAARHFDRAKTYGAITELLVKRSGPK
ncbi:MAG: glycosyltransferase family 4 protein [Gemmatimonadaceae bacterium]